MLFFLWWYIIDCLQCIFKALYAAFFTFKINTHKNLELKQSNEYMWQLGNTSSIFMYIEIYHCWNIFSKHRKNQKLAPGMLNVKTSQGKKKVDSKIVQKLKIQIDNECIPH